MALMVAVKIQRITIKNTALGKSKMMGSPHLTNRFPRKYLHRIWVDTVHEDKKIFRAAKHFVHRNERKIPGENIKIIPAEEKTQLLNFSLRQLRILASKHYTHGRKNFPAKKSVCMYIYWCRLPDFAAAAGGS
jgi:hypothetical protein